MLRLSSDETLLSFTFLSKVDVGRLQFVSKLLAELAVAPALWDPVCRRTLMLQPGAAASYSSIFLYGLLAGLPDCHCELCGDTMVRSDCSDVPCVCVPNRCSRAEGVGENTVNLKQVQPVLATVCRGVVDIDQLRADVDLVHSTMCDVLGARSKTDRAELTEDLLVGTHVFSLVYHPSKVYPRKEEIDYRQKEIDVLSAWVRAGGSVIIDALELAEGDPRGILRSWLGVGDAKPPASGHRLHPKMYDVVVHNNDFIKASVDAQSILRGPFGTVTKFSSGHLTQVHLLPRVWGPSAVSRCLAPNLILLSGGPCGKGRVLVWNAYTSVMQCSTKIKGTGAVLLKNFWSLAATTAPGRVGGRSLLADGVTSTSSREEVAFASPDDSSYLSFPAYYRCDDFYGGPRRDELVRVDIADSAMALFEGMNLVYKSVDEEDMREADSEMVKYFVRLEGVDHRGLAGVGELVFYEDKLELEHQWEPLPVLSRIVIRRVRLDEIVAIESTGISIRVYLTAEAAIARDALSEFVLFAEEIDITLAAQLVLLVSHLSADGVLVSRFDHPLEISPPALIARAMELMRVPPGSCATWYFRSIKCVGDGNVQRHRISWKTRPFASPRALRDALFRGERIGPCQLQVRGRHDPVFTWWGDDDDAEIELRMATTDTIVLSSARHGGMNGTFNRVTGEEAAEYIDAHVLDWE